MAVISNILQFFGLRDNKVRSIQRKGQRGYEAGKVTRFNSRWFTESASINHDIRNSMRRVRFRAQDLRKNNPYANAIRIKNRANIIGPEGFKLQVKALDADGSYDEYANNTIEGKFAIWSRRQYCTMSKRYPFLLVQWLVDEQWKNDGEFLVRMIRNVPLSDNPCGFSLELLCGEDLDETYSAELPNGNIVIMGVEIDQWRAFQRFYFKKRELKDELSGGLDSFRKHEIVDAKDVLFGFDPEHPKQERGMTKLAAVMLTLKGIDKWEDASLVNATAAAMKMGFLSKKNPNALDYPDETDKATDGNGDAASGNKDYYEGGKYADFEAGIIEELPEGYEFQGFDPKYPHEQHESFLKSMLRKVASAFGMSYNSTFNDLEGVSYSSMRSGLQDERDNWMVEQAMFRELFLIPLFENWLKNALQTGFIPLPYAKFDKYNAPVWKGRRWPWVDPLKDIQANILAVKFGWETNSSIASDRGNDYYENLKALAAEKKAREDAGLMLGDDIEISMVVNSGNDTEQPNNQSKNRTKNFRNVV